MKPDTSKIPLDKLKPDTNRQFNAQKCMEEGGVAVARNGNRIRVIAGDHPKGQDSQVLSYELCSDDIEHQLNFRPDGTSLLGQYRGKVVAFHPILFSDKGQPLWLPEPPSIEGYELDRVEEVEVTPKLRGIKEMHRIWCGSVWHLLPSVPGYSSTYLASYRKVEPEITFDEKGFPSFMAEPPVEEGYELIRVCKGSEVKFFPHDAHHIQAGEPDCPHWLPGILERKAIGWYPNHYYALYRKVAPKLKEDTAGNILIPASDLDQLLEARKLVDQLLDNSESESGAKDTQMLVDYKAKYRQQ